MSDGQAGTPPASQDGTNGGTPATQKDGSGSDDQKWKEALVWKQKAEEFNKVADEKKALEARLAEMERLAYSRGAGQATDPQAELIAQLREQAAYDPVARGTLMNMQMTAQAQAEMWLTQELLSIPEAKRAKVAGIVRGSGYQTSVANALSVVTDPDAESQRLRLAELEAENARLKERATLPNGASPAFAPPAQAASDNRETLPWSEAKHILKMGGPKAVELRNKMDSGTLKPDYTR